MAEELNTEEENAAGEINASAAEDKTTIAKIGDQMTGVTNLLNKAIEEGKPAPVVEPEPAFDINSLTPEDLAKSLGEKTDEEKADFVSRITESLGLNVGDVYDEDGGQYFTPEMMKSLQDATEDDQIFKKSLVAAMDETNARNAKMAEIHIHTLHGMSKSIDALVEANKKLSEKLEKAFPITELVPADGGDSDSPLPDLENSSTQPISVQTGSEFEKSVVTPESMIKSITKTWPARFGDPVEAQIQAKYADYVTKYGVEETLGLMSEEHREQIQGHL